MACHGSHLCVDCNGDENLTWTKTLKMGEVVLKRKSVFVGHGYVHHAGPKLKGDSVRAYRTYLVPEGADLEDKLHLPM